LTILILHLLDKAIIKLYKEIEMQTRKLGNSDLNITPVGYGAWAVGGSGWQFAWGSQDDNDSIAAVHRSLELGVNWIDTAASTASATPRKL
jgi:diketogulonate reductase-like aldo/keto reductase